MAPKSLQKQVQTRTDEEQVEDAFKGLCDYLSKQKSKRSPIKSLNLVKAIRDLWESDGEHANVVHDEIISNLVEILEDGGKDFCNRMVEPMFCLVLDTILRADATYIQAQRGVCLLAESLESKQVGDKAHQKRHATIGSQCLHALVAYFTNMENDSLMRRWIGILCRLLVRGSEKNLEMLENCPEDFRRGIGSLVFREIDDSIKIIAAQLIKTTGEGGANLPDLWPTDIDKGLYKEFPTSTRAIEDWPEVFHEWLTGLEKSFIPPTPIGKIAFVRRIQYRIDSSHRDSSCENVFMFMHEDILTFLVPSVNGHMDRILDVSPLSGLESITGIRDESSQAQEVEVRFSVGSNNSAHTFINASETSIGEIVVVMELKSAGTMLAELVEACPDTRIIGLDGKVTARKLKSRGLSSDAISVGEPHSPRRSNSDEDSPSNEETQQGNDARGEVSSSRSPTKDEATQTIRPGSALNSNNVQDEDLYYASPPKPRLRAMKADTQREQTDQDNLTTRPGALNDDSSPINPKTGGRNVNTQQEQMGKDGPTRKPRARTTVRPKAKAPIMQSHRRFDNSQNQPQKKLTVISERTMTKKQTQHTAVTASADELALSSSNAPKAARGPQGGTHHQKPQSNQNPPEKVVSSKAQPGNLPRPKPTTSKATAAKAPPPSKIESFTATGFHKNKAADAYDEDSITSPDIYDASTPKTRPSISHRSQKAGAHSTKETNQSQKKQYSLPASTRQIDSKASWTGTQQGLQSQKKRYSLPSTKPSATQSMETSQYDIPPDDDDDMVKKTRGKTSKAHSKPKPKAAASIGKVTKQNSVKFSAATAVKKRQSAPAMLDGNMVPVRSSQRAAAAKAKDKLRDIDDDGDNLDVDIDEEPPALPNENSRLDAKTTKIKSKDDSKVEAEVVKDRLPQIQHKEVEKTRNNHSTNTTNLEPEVTRLASRPKADDAMEMVKKQPSDANQNVTDKSNDSTPTQMEADKEVQRLQHEDAMELGLVQQGSPLNPEDLHADITPQKFDEPPVKQESSRIAIGHDKIKSNAETKTDFADGLTRILGGLSDACDDVPSQEPQSREPKLLSQAITGPDTRKEQPQSNVHDPIVISSPLATSSSIESLERNEDAEQSNDMASTPSAEESITRKAPQHQDFAQISSFEMIPSPQQNTSSSSGDLCGDYSTSRTEMLSEPTVTKTVFMKVDVFKKPELPARLAPQLKVPDGDAVESATTISAVKAGGEPNAIPLMNTDDKIEPEASIDGTRSKRKAPILESSTFKKQRKENKRGSQIKEDAALENIVKGPLPRKALDVKPASPSPATGSLHLPLHNSREAASAELIVAKDPSRKPNIIAFDRSGPRNQGQSSVTRTPMGRDTRIIETEELPERKRKRNQEAVTDDPSPPKKRQNSSPIQDDDDYDHEDNAPMYDQSPVATAPTRHVSVRSRSTRSRSNRQSSQPSRVDLNGSPVAAGNVDHFGRLEERLSQDSNKDMQNEQGVDPTRPSTSTQEVLALFGPKIQLGAKPKLRGSPPEEVTSRYIAHEKTRNGHYKEVGSKEVIAPENVVDPFFDRARKLSRSSDFTERLKEASKPKGQLNGVAQPNGHPRTPQNDKLQAIQSLPQTSHENAQVGRHANATNYRKSTRSQFVDEDLEKTLVASDLRRSRHKSPESDMSGSSQASRSSNNSKKDDHRVLRDVWNMAIRPHYSDAHKAIHSIADEVITRLSDEEERVQLIIKQYDENGRKILDKLAAKREGEKKAILRKLDLKSKQMMTAYTGAKDYIQEKMDELKENPISVFQKEWHKKQDEIQKLISAGMAELK